MNKKIATAVAVGAIVIITIIIGGYFWLQNQSKFGQGSMPTQKETEKCAGRELDKTIAQNTNANLNIDRSDTIYSPDRSLKVYLEKEYNPEVQRFVRQSVILENLKSGNKKVLNEIIFTASDAVQEYAKDGCDKNKEDCCKSMIDFDEFEPIVWLTNDMIEVNQYFANYECAGTVTSKTIYNNKGEDYFTAELIKKFDYKTAENTDDGWSIAKACSNDDKIAFILAKNMFGGYSYLEYSKKDDKFTSQLIEKNSKDEDFSDFKSECENILNLNMVKEFFK
jgi:hypothetical protein